MALIFCPNCGAQVSTFAEKCVKCHNRLPTQNKIENVPNEADNYNPKINRRVKTAEQNGEMPKSTSIFLIGVLFIGILILFLKWTDEKDANSIKNVEVISTSENNSNNESVNNSILNQTSGNHFTESESKISVERENKQCYQCKGAGIITCGMCGGTGTNNMGMVCGCVTYVANCRTLGRRPTRTALQWTCEHCKGTGYER